jgi:hypothetical protein
MQSVYKNTAQTLNQLKNNNEMELARIDGTIPRRVFRKMLKRVELCPPAGWRTLATYVVKNNNNKLNMQL